MRLIVSVMTAKQYKQMYAYKRYVPNNKWVQ